MIIFALIIISLINASDKCEYVKSGPFDEKLYFKVSDNFFCPIQGTLFIIGNFMGRGGGGVEII